VAEAVVALRKELTDLGVDAGAGTIQWHLGRRGLATKVPSQATIWRVLRRRGFVTDQPGKRPHSSYRRFEASAPNELWQADCMDWTIATGVVKILSFIDDHSRVELAVKALGEATTDATWDTFCQAAETWGLPVGQLTDNGLNFSGRLRGFEVRFETELRAVGVVPKTSRPYHPQTCRKVERFQQTLKKWLRRRPLAATSSSSKPKSTASWPTTTTSDPTAASAGSPRRSAGPPPRQLSTSAWPCPPRPGPSTP
jgi:transposase InsO family protein